MDTQKNFRHTLTQSRDPRADPRKNFRLTVTIAAGLFLLALLALPAILPPEQVTAQVVPTPIANLPVNAPDAVLATFIDNDTSTSDAGGPAVQIFTTEYCYMQYIIDQTGAGNSTTLIPQHSMDGVHWVNGANLVTNNTADATGIVKVPIFARYTRIFEDHTNTTPLTVTVRALCK